MKYFRLGKLKRRSIVFFKYLLFFMLIVFIWQFTTKYFKIPNYLLPLPSEIYNEFTENYSALLNDTLITGLESLIGFIFATIFASIFSIIFSQSKGLHNKIMPFLIGFKAIPLIAIAPLLTLWLGNGFMSKAIMSATICFFPIVVNLTKGLLFVPNDQKILLESYAATKVQIFFRIRIPNSLPFLFSALKISSTLSIVGAIVAEFAGANKGIGFTILVASLRLETALLFCGIILASLLGIIFYYLIEFVEKRIVFWLKED